MRSSRHEVDQVISKISSLLQVQRDRYDQHSDHTLKYSVK
jgi:hypothetical protein